MEITELANRLETLELKLMHHEASIEELTRTVLEQEQQISSQSLTIERLETIIRSFADSSTASPGTEPPPPHY